MTHWGDAGFGTDPEGDARRRAELEPARLDPEDLRDPTGLARLAASRLDPDRLAVLGGYGLPAARAQQEEREDAHAVTRTEYGSSVAIVCACGRWECIVTGPSSARWAGADHARHVRDEEAGRAD